MRMDKFLNNSIEEYLERLGSGAPTPGGGAAAALSSAQGAALIMMVANHTIGKKKYAEFEEFNRDILEEAEVLMKRLADGIEKDAEAFDRVSEAYAMPRDFGGIVIDKVSETIAMLRNEGYNVDEPDEEEGMTAEVMDQIDAALADRRSAKIAEVSIEAAEAPLAVMEDSISALRLAATMPGRSNRNLLSDVYVAALSLYAGIQSANYNIEANLPAIEKADPACASSMRLRAAAILSEAEEIRCSLIDRD